MGWMNVPGEPTLAVHPDQADQLHAMQRIKKGTPVELVIQLDTEGKRRILSFQDLTLPRRIPL